MKRTGMIIVLISITLTAFSQAKPAFSQYILNNYILNPAISGIENYTDIRGSYRRQWQGIDGAPVNTYFSAHTAIGKTDFNTSPVASPVNETIFTLNATSGLPGSKGKSLPVDTYYYILELNNRIGSKPITGYATIII